MQSKSKSRITRIVAILLALMALGAFTIFGLAQKQYDRITLSGKESITDIENNFTARAADYLETISSKYHNRINSLIYSQRIFMRSWLIDELEKAGYSKEQIHIQRIFDDLLYKGKNIILTVPGEDQSKQIIVGAHYDSDGDGDNGSGVALLLATAVGFKDETLPYTVKYVFFDAEEIGTIGSRYYVNHMSEEEKTATVFMVNIDAIGAGDYCNIYGGHYNPETNEITKLDAYHTAIANAKSLGFYVYDTDYLEGYYEKNGAGPALDDRALFTNPWTLAHPSPENFKIPSPCAYPASDAKVFDEAGVPYVMFDSTNWYATGQTITGTSYSVYHDTIQTEIGLGGKIMNTSYDKLAYLEANLPGRIVAHYNLLSPILSSLITSPALTN